MQKIAIAIGLAVSLTYPSVGYADQIPNGCGPKGYGWLVPDSTFLSGCTFKQSCDIHDRCYSRCAKDGDLEGLPTCDNEAEKAERRNKCDQDFFTNISYFNSDRGICRLYGKAYAYFVSKGGRGFFQGYERPEVFFNEISNRPADIDNLITQIDRQAMTISPSNESEAVVIFKSQDSYNLGEIVGNNALVNQLSRGVDGLVPAMQFDQAQ